MNLIGGEQVADTLGDMDLAVRACGQDEPHPDFAGCVSHLGRWEGSSDITFGYEGKPMYIQGPYDDAARIIRTLRRAVGNGNFNATIAG